MPTIAPPPTAQPTGPETVSKVAPNGPVTIAAPVGMLIDTVTVLATTAAAPAPPINAAPPIAAAVPPTAPVVQCAI